MSDKVDEKIENEVCTKKKEITECPVKDKQASDETSEKENGTVRENENGRTEGDTEEVDGKEQSDAVVCPVKRKSGAGGDAPEEKAADDVTPEKKAKLDEASADVESNGEPEVAA